MFISQNNMLFLAQITSLLIRTSLIIPCLWLIFYVSPLYAQTQEIEWVPTNGPGGGQVYCFTVLGENTFVGTNAGVFRAASGGASGSVEWSKTGKGLLNTKVLSLASLGSIVFAGTEGGLFQSNDSGATWFAPRENFTNRPISALVAQGSTLLLISSTQLLRSSDTSKTWIPAQFSTTPGGILSIATNGSDFFVGTGTGKIFRSTNNGVQWQEVFSSLSQISIGALSGNSTYLVAGTSSGQILRSLNNGTTWNPVNIGIPTRSIETILVDGQRIFAGPRGSVIRSEDGGTTWRELGFTAGQIATSLARQGNSLYIGAGNGVHYSNDNGTTLGLGNTGLAATEVHVVQASGDTLFAGTHTNGIFRSLDKGTTWETMNNGLFTRDVLSLAAAGNTMFAGTHGSGVYRSADRGQSWQQTFGVDLARLVYAVEIIGNTILAIDDFGYLARSTDNGRTWQSRAAEFKGRGYAISVIRGSIYAGTGGGMYRSTDDGMTWTLVPAFNSTFNGPIIEFNNTLFGASGQGILRSADGGRTWTESMNDLRFQVNSFHVFEGSLYAVAGTQVYRLEGVFNWKNVSTGLPSLGVSSLTTSQLAVSQSTLFTATSSSGVYRAARIERFPILAATPAQIRFTPTQPNTPSNIESYTVSGQFLTTNTVSIVAPPQVQISLSASGPFLSNISLPVSNGNLPETRIFARVLGSSSQNITSEITNTSSVSSANVSIQAAILSPTIPRQGLLVNPDALNFGNHVIGTPLNPLSYTISGVVQGAPSLRVVAPPYITVSLSPTGPFTSSATVPSDNGLFNAVRVYVRWHTESVNRLGTAITHVLPVVQDSTNDIRVNLSGNIFLPPVPVISITTTHPNSTAGSINLGTIVQNSALPQASYTITGQNLLGNVVITAPQGFQLQNPQTLAWENTLSLQPNQNRSTTQTVSLRAISTSSPGTIQGIFTNSTLGGDSLRTVVLGTIVAPPPPPLEWSVAPSPLSFDTVFVGNTAIRTFELIGRNIPQGAQIRVTSQQFTENTIEFSLNPTGPFISTLLFIAGGGVFRGTFYARLNAASAGNFTVPGGIQTSVVATTNTRASVTVLANILERPQLLTARPDSVRLDTTIQMDSAQVRQYTLVGENLVASVQITPPSGVLLFHSSVNRWVSSLTLSTNANGSVMETILVRMDSSRIQTLLPNALIQHTSGIARASVQVSGAVVPLSLPLSAETSLEMRLVAQRQPMLYGDTARIQLWLRDSRFLTPRLISRFARTLRAVVRIDTNNLTILGVNAPPISPRLNAPPTSIRFETTPTIPRTSSIVPLLITRRDTSSLSNLLLGELLLRATFGKTTTNNIRLMPETQWFTSDGTPSTLRRSWIPEFVSLSIVPLFTPRQQVSVLKASIMQNPTNTSLYLAFSLEKPSISSESNVDVECFLFDAAGKEMLFKRWQQRLYETSYQESMSLSGFSAGAYHVVLKTKWGQWHSRVDIVR